jgi:hypothetical protein
MFDKYSEFSCIELRELLLRGELVHDFMTEDDYSDIIENELEQLNPNMEVLDLCIQGLNQYDEYKALENIKIDINAIFNENTNKNKRILNIRIIKVALIAAAITVIALFTQLVSLAFGFDLFGYIFNWNDEKVYIKPDLSNEAGDFLAVPEFFMYESKESVPDELLLYVPEYIQNNYIFTEASYLYAGESFIFFITYTSHSDINLTFYVNQSVNYSVEKDNDYFEEFTKNGITYTLYKNLEYHKVLWIKNGLLYDMSINIPLDEVKRIIDNF